MAQPSHLTLSKFLMLHLDALSAIISPQAGAGYLVLDYVRDIFCVAKALNWSKFHLIGHSLGASISSLFAGTFPEQVCSLTLVEGELELCRGRGRATQSCALFHSCE